MRLTIDINDKLSHVEQMQMKVFLEGMISSQLMSYQGVRDGSEIPVTFVAYDSEGNGVIICPTCGDQG